MVLPWRCPNAPCFGAQVFQQMTLVDGWVEAIHLLLGGSSHDLDTWLITMVIVCPLSSRVVGPLPFMAFWWLINGGDPNYLQVLGWSSKYPLNSHDFMGSVENYSPLNERKRISEIFPPIFHWTHGLWKEGWPDEVWNFFHPQENELGMKPRPERKLNYRGPTGVFVCQACYFQKGS